MAQRVIGNTPVLNIECISPRKNKWKIRWDITEQEDGLANWIEHDLDHKPTEQEIKDIIMDWYNTNIKEKIVSSFIWNDIPVWLSLENQMNYKSIYDIAKQGIEEILPVTFKLGTDEYPVYKSFSTLEEL